MEEHLLRIGSFGISISLNGDPPAPDPGNSGDCGGAIEFEFQPDDPATGMLTADELFSGGRLVPLHPPAAVLPPRGEVEDEAPTAAPAPEMPRSTGSSADDDLFAPSPRAPTCSIRWRDLLGLRKKIQIAGSPVASDSSSSSAAADPKSGMAAAKRLARKHCRSSSSIDASSSSLKLLPLGGSDLRLIAGGGDGVSRSSSSSSSSSSSGADLEDQIFRLPLRPARVKIPAVQRSPSTADGAPRHGRRSARPSSPPPPLVESIDSPRLNASGKVVFFGVDRCSSSPAGGSSFRRGGGASARRPSVRVAPVLNVPGSAMFALGHFFPIQQQRKEKEREEIGNASQRSAPASSAAADKHNRVVMKGI